MIYAVQTIWHVKEIVQFMSRICSGNSEGKYALYRTRNGYHQLICPEVGNVKDILFFQCELLKEIINFT